MIVRKHPAPEGALRQSQACLTQTSDRDVRKHPAPEGALRRRTPQTQPKASCRQKAPSTRRCIKTFLASSRMERLSHVRKHPAPEGALRHQCDPRIRNQEPVRKHPAPEGALRRHVVQHFLPVVVSENTQHQKRLFTGLTVRWLPTAPENGQSDRQSLEQALRVTPNPPATTDAVLLDDNQDLHPRWIRDR